MGEESEPATEGSEPRALSERLDELTSRLAGLGVALAIVATKIKDAGGNSLMTPEETLRFLGVKVQVQTPMIWPSSIKM